jgi:hypothetical protein
VSDSNGSGATEVTNSGAKLAFSGSPSSSTNRATEKTPPAALLTPSTWRTSSSASAGNAGGCISSPWPVVLGLIETSVPS